MKYGSNIKKSKITKAKKTLKNFITNDFPREQTTLKVVLAHQPSSLVVGREKSRCDLLVETTAPQCLLS